MRTFWAVLKNDYFRTLPRLVPLLVMTAVTLGSIALAVYLTGVQQVKGHIAFVAPSAAEAPQSSKALEITVLPQRPPRSDLIEQKYDAYVTRDETGNYRIETLRSGSYEKMLLSLLGHPGAGVKSGETDRGTGVNIIGFMMMFLLMIAFSNLFAFADDKEQGQLHRIAVSPASFLGYLAAHCAYCLSLLLPEFLMLAALKGCGRDIGFSLPQYAGLMALLGFLGISFALLLDTLIKKPDNASMLGNSVTVLTTVLSGGFYSSAGSGAALDAVTKLLPQKEIMTFAQALQNGDAWRHAGSALYAAAFPLVLFAVSAAVLRRMYVKKA